MFSISGAQKREAVQLQHLQHSVPAQKFSRQTSLPTLRRATLPVSKLRVLLHVDPPTSRTHQEATSDVASGSVYRHRNELPQHDVAGTGLSSDRSCSGKNRSDNLGLATSAATDDAIDSSERNDLPDEPVGSDLPATCPDVDASPATTLPWNFRTFDFGISILVDFCQQRIFHFCAAWHDDDVTAANFLERPVCPAAYS